MTPTDAILAAIRSELEFWRPILDARAGELDSVRIIVNLDKRAQRPRSIVISPEVRQEIGTRP